MAAYWMCVGSFAHRLSGLVASQDPEAEACVLPPQEDVLLLEVWDCRSNGGGVTSNMLSSFQTNQKTTPALQEL